MSTSVEELEQQAAALSLELPEEVALWRHHEVACAPVAGEVRNAADDRRGDAGELAHDQLGGACNLVGDGDRRALELVADGVPLPLEVEQDLEAGRADRDVGRPLAPRAAEGVRHEDADRAARAFAEPSAD